MSEKTISQTLTKLDSMMATLDVKFNTAKKYNDCNSTLPSVLPYITKDEAQRAYRLLTRKFGRKQIRHPFKDKWLNRKMPIQIYAKEPRRCWICLSGDPSTLHNGWRRLIHDVSHMVHKWLRPRMNHHCYQQAELELDMIKFVQSKNTISQIFEMLIFPSLHLFWPK